MVINLILFSSPSAGVSPRGSMKSISSNTGVVQPRSCLCTDLQIDVSFRELRIMIHVSRFYDIADLIPLFNGDIC